MEPEDYEDFYEDNENEEESESFDDQDILELFKSCMDEAKDDDIIRDRGVVVENAMSGRNPNTLLPSVTNYFNEPEQMYITMQILQNVVLAWSAIITKNRPSVAAYPAGNTIEDTVAAKLATKVIEYLERENGMADKWQETARYAATHGTSMMYVYYSKEDEKLCFEPLSIYDCFLENKPSGENIDWCIIRTYIKPREAKKLLGDKPMPKTTYYTDAEGIDRNNVIEKNIFYHLPCEEYPNGLFAQIIGTNVVAAQKFPYIFQDTDSKGNEKYMLPVFAWGVNTIRGSTLCSTWAWQCSAPQMAINQNLTKLNEDSLTSRVMRKIPASLRDANLFESKNSTIWFDNASISDVSQIGYVDPPKSDPLVWNIIKQNAEAIYTTSGVSPATAGASTNQSGKALAYQAELDSDKHSGAFKSFERCVQSTFEFALKCIQKYYTKPRLIDVLGRDSISFRGADIAGVTVTLEPRSERESSSAQKLQNVKEDMASGFAGKEALLDAAPTPISAAQARYSNQIIEDFLDDKPLDITPSTVAPEILLTVLSERIEDAYLQKDTELVKDLQAFKSAYEDIIAQSQVPDAPAGDPQAPATAPLPENVSETDSYQSERIGE